MRTNIQKPQILYLDYLKQSACEPNLTDLRVGQKLHYTGEHPKYHSGSTNFLGNRRVQPLDTDNKNSHMVHNRQKKGGKFQPTAWSFVVA